MDAYAGIICPRHNEVDITYQEYKAQMANPWARWKCPKCGQTSEFNDDRYEELNLEPEAEPTR